ncbi:MAG: sulfite reductase subunit C [Planctomycetes bacterium]|nr:sulfite reductase subunit C [Planctomycetota bacterium]
MPLDLNAGEIRRNAYRITSRRDRTCLRVRVPGGCLAARHLEVIRAIAEDYGDGTVHLTTRQGFEIPGIAFEKIPSVNRALAALIEDVEIAIGVELGAPENGYPAAGTRNVVACIGNRVCPFANLDTTALAMRIERSVFPNDHHLKIAVTGCPNDCIKAHLQDFGVIGQADIRFDAQRCLGCEACVKYCSRHVNGSISMRNGRPVRDERHCLGCGGCVLKCPTGARTRDPVKYFRLIILGRTGKRNPRLGATFLEWAPEDAVVQIILNTYKFIERHIDRALPKEHLGYIVDRTGYQTFRETVLDGVQLGDKTRVAETLHFAGYTYS